MSDRTCPKCNTFLRLQDKKCPKCNFVIDDSERGDFSRLPNCPVCKIPIYPATFGGFEIFHCAECEATAFEKQVLMKLQPTDKKVLNIGILEREHVRPPYFEPRDKPPFLICPYCGKKMLETRLGNMTIDLCEKCSAIFLERGKEKHVNDIIGPYKMKMLGNGPGGGSSRHSRSRR